MEYKKKKQYAAPTTKPVDIQMSSMLCSSPTMRILLIDQVSGDQIPSSSFGDTWTWDE